MDFESYYNDLKLRLARLEEDYRKNEHQESTHQYLEGSIWQLKQVIMELEVFR